VYGYPRHTGVLAQLTMAVALEGYVESRFRESRDAAAQLTFVGGEKRLALISDMMVMDVEHNKLVRLGDA